MSERIPCFFPLRMKKNWDKRKKRILDPKRLKGLDPKDAWAVKQAVKTTEEFACKEKLDPNELYNMYVDLIVGEKRAYYTEEKIKEEFRIATELLKELIEEES